LSTQKLLPFFLRLCNLRAEQLKEKTVKKTPRTFFPDFVSQKVLATDFGSFFKNLCRQCCQMVYFQTKNHNFGLEGLAMEDVGIF
jgi:hypothetical protein